AHRLGHRAARHPVFPRRISRHAARRSAVVRGTTPVLEVSGLTKRFGGLVAVKGLSFALRGGEILGLIGPNGSGKSTAMKSILGVEVPSEGSVKLDGIELAGLPAYRVARHG